MDGNVGAVYAEYPFLATFIKRAKVQQAGVSRWNEGWRGDRPGCLARLTLLEASPYAWWPGGIYRLYLLDAQGKIVTRVGAFLKFFTRDETIEQALHRIGEQKARQVRHALFIGNKNFELYVLPPGYDNVAEWVDADTIETRHKLEAMKA